MALMKRELINYDIFPKVIPTGKEVTITVKPLGGHAAFAKEKEHLIAIHTTTEGAPYTYPNRKNYAEYTMTVSEDGCFHITHTFEKESEYFIRINADDKRIVQLSVYAVEDDLIGRYPYMGDMHMHSTRSDGKEHPFIVAANYRKAGYDFMAITDHRKYYPSLETRNFYADLNLDLKLYPGEEIHLPGNDIHIVNFAGDYSVNGLLDCSLQYVNRGADPKWRSINGECPDVMTEEQYRAEVEALAETLDIPENVEKFPYASCVWICNHIKKGNGLGIFAHPYWISDMWQIHEPFTQYMLANKPFDAFEVLGGENYYQQNGFQTAIYYDEYRRGNILPIVGSTDSHNSTENNRNAAICSTIVFAHDNERADILQSIKDKYSVAVDTISTEYRLVGEFRLQKYACFLMENFYPLHDLAARTDGEVMRKYYLGEADAAVVEATAALSQKMFDKYFVLA